MSLKPTARHIWKNYDGNPVLKDCSFSFEKNGIYVLTGPNGSGKSTFLRICALLEKPDKGEVEYSSDGNPVSNGIELKRRITLVLPRVGVFNTTVFKNVAYGLRIRGMQKREMESRVDAMLEFVGLIHKRDQNALTLSSGETQRLGIARALAIGPETLFLDEPTASVDVKNTEIIENIILTMGRKGGSTVVVTTHDREQAERLNGCLLVMKDGRIDGAGPPS
ncbi:MAG: energy-coupling factor ABC transporter ATP-binding protein [Nitrospirae bacterium]|nr:energy-coupling factor ABC transporter ATP-binding protein [Nitrospirota bacterium]MCL5238280.1 energy-coupling factor ABC transporter ATP-binding protein [Nitrospirota bacterium]